ncbi:acyl carrier protein [Kitasatospora sp. NPDC036755]|uniref:acyl carrier protein n=1 Tax=Kitasatospora sp. NPDC036755 TaxID=3154600 RepID=UPI0034080B9B
MWDEQFEQLLRAHLPYLPAQDELGADVALADLGLDSMSTVELLASLEKRYDVRFLDDALSMETFATAATLWKQLSELVDTAR